MPLNRRTLFLTLTLVISLFAAACSAASPPLQTPSAALTTAPTATFTPQPTPTTPPPVAVLLAPAGSDPELVASLQTRLAELAAQDGLQFETRPALSAADIGSNLRIVVALAPDPGVAQLATGAPGTQFLALGIPDLQPAANLSIVGSPDGQPDQLGFIAGYLAAVVTEDWRTGVIGTDDAAGQLASQGFRNGVVFFCGLCRPAFPPFYEYPILASPPGQAAADSLISQGVQTVYLAPQAADPALLEYLAQTNLSLIGSAPPPENLKSRWIATIQTDLLAGVERLWPDLVSGIGGASLPTPIVITDRNEALFSVGRQRLVDETLAAMQAGTIGTGVAQPGP
jgi:hypothetical protein